MKIIDISTPITSEIPVWPNTPQPQFSLLSSLKKGDDSDDTKIETSIHAGTHIDAPSHFLENGKTIDQMDLSIFIGPVYVASLPNLKKITKEDIEKLEIPNKITRVLFKTLNSSLWHENVSSFHEEYVALSEDGAKAVSDMNLKLVGIDYLSIAKFDETKPVHKILLEKEIGVLEGLNLSNVDEGEYQLHAIPVLIKGAEAAPVRAILVSE